MENYAHLISTIHKDGKWILRIERIFSDGKKDWVNDRDLPPFDKSDKWDVFEYFMASLGKAIGIDSPGVRDHFRIMEE